MNTTHDRYASIAYHTAAPTREAKPRRMTNLSLATNIHILRSATITETPFRRPPIPSSSSSPSLHQLPPGMIDANLSAIPAAASLRFPISRRRSKPSMGRESEEDDDLGGERWRRRDRRR